MTQKFLDLEKALKLDDKKCIEIISLYRDMINYIQHTETYDMGVLLLNTLDISGYLIDARDKKINSIINED